MNIYSQNVYEAIENGIKKYILIIYNISGNHYVGITIHNTNNSNFTYIKSIDKYVDINDLQEYNRKDISRIIFCKRKILKSKRF